MNCIPLDRILIIRKKFKEKAKYLNDLQLRIGQLDTTVESDKMAHYVLNKYFEKLRDIKIGYEK